MKQTVADLVKEQRYYEQQRARSEQCRESWVQITNAIVFNGVAHSGTAAHICVLKPDHGGMCQCACRVRALVKK